MSDSLPRWYNATLGNFWEKEEKIIILNFCKALSLECKCDSSFSCCSKYCVLCRGILGFRNSAQININKDERISVNHVFNYYSSEVWRQMLQMI